MTNQQRKILKYIYKSPKTIQQIKEKFNFSDQECRIVLNGNDDFYLYYDVVKNTDSFNGKVLSVSHAGKAYCDDYRQQQIAYWLPIIIDTVLSVAALIISLSK